MPRRAASRLASRHWVSPRMAKLTDLQLRNAKPRGKKYKLSLGADSRFW